MTFCQIRDTRRTGQKKKEKFSATNGITDRVFDSTWPESFRFKLRISSTSKLESMSTKEKFEQVRLNKRFRWHPPFQDFQASERRLLDGQLLFLRVPCQPDSDFFSKERFNGVSASASRHDFELEHDAFFVLFSLMQGVCQV